MKTAPKTTTSRTVDDFAKALGVSRSTFLRHKKRGLPEPRPGERLSAWRRRAERWQQQHVRAPGRHGSVDAAQALHDYRRARAERAELRLARVAEQVHDTARCTQDQARRIATMLSCFADVPASLAATVPELRDRYQLRDIADRTVREAHQTLYGRVQVADRVAAAARPTTPEPDPALPLKERSDFWLAVWRNCRADVERRELARERGDVHDVVACEGAECDRIRSFVHGLSSLPDLWGAVLMHLPAAGVHVKATEDLSRVADLLRRDDVLPDDAGEPEPVAPSEEAEDTSAP